MAQIPPFDAEDAEDGDGGLKALLEATSNGQWQVSVSDEFRRLISSIYQMLFPQVCQNAVPSLDSWVLVAT
jgi:hypothetical protein